MGCLAKQPEMVMQGDRKITCNLKYKLVFNTRSSLVYKNYGYYLYKQSKLFLKHVIVVLFFGLLE
jgi:hypothetical protein